MEQVTRKITIYRIDIAEKKSTRQTDFVAKETPLHVFLGKTHYATIMCTPAYVRELVTGHLLSEGIVKSKQSIKNIEINTENNILACRVELDPSVNIEAVLRLSKPYARLITSTCGSSPPANPPKPSSRIGLKRLPDKQIFNAETVSACTQSLNKTATIFRMTGGVHAAAIYDSKGGLVAHAEDVGRHNAVDKAIGVALERTAGFEECFLALSGRVSGDIVLKALRVKLPLVASLAAPLSSGVEAAARFNVSLVGFVRGKRMNVYAAPKRIRL